MVNSFLKNQLYEICFLNLAEASCAASRFASSRSIRESESLLQNLAAQRARLLMVQDQELEAGNAQAVATLAARIHQNLELVGRYLGELHQHSTKTVVNILLTPEYLELRNALVRALAPYPEARRAVAAVLHSREGSAAQSMASVPALPAPEIVQ